MCFPGGKNRFSGVNMTMLMSLASGQRQLNVEGQISHHNSRKIPATYEFSGGANSKKEQKVLGRTNRLFSLIRHVPH
jgi:hypothetical protein